MSFTHLFDIRQETLLVSLDSRRLVAAERLAHGLANPDVHALLHRELEEFLGAVEDPLALLGAHAVAGEVEEAVRRAGMAHSIDNGLLVLCRGIGVSKGTDIHSRDGIGCRLGDLLDAAHFVPYFGFFIR